MNRVEIAAGIVRYQFPPHEGKHLGGETLEAFFEMAGDGVLQRPEGLRLNP